ncbi:MAG: hypothetical protein KAI24_26555, partial [Planctomycetes bacterium]|nr:hypothetical protein [Planctomycetota bacterium]
RVLVSQQLSDGLGAAVASPLVLDVTGATTPVVGIDAVARNGALQAAVLASGESVLVGSFASVQGQVAGGAASYMPGCSAGAVSLGSGCDGVTMAIERRAWLGDVFASRTTGIAPSSIAVQVFGVGTVALPLNSVLPQALPNCTLFAAPDVLQLALPVGGELTTTFAIPSTPSLLQATFAQQVVSFELGAGGAIVQVRASDGFELTVGVW